MKIWFRQLVEFRKADEGQALVFVALSMMTLMLAAGLGVDVGYIHYQKEQMQKAADAAALAGAAALVYDEVGNAKVAAQNDSTANGFQNTQNGVLVTVNIPPATNGDPFQGNSSAVEVIVAQARPTFFMKLLGLGTVNVSARAVASIGSSTNCIIILDPTGSDSFLVDGNVSVTSACGIEVNSTSADALHTDGASGGVTVSGNGLGIGVRGDYSCNGHGGDCTGVLTPLPVTSIPPVKDPLLTYAAPTYGSCDRLGSTITGGTIAPNSPGVPFVICGPISLAGSQSVMFQPGTYILIGGMSLAGGSSVSGTGVTFYVTKNGTYSYSGINMTGNSVSTLSAPTTGSLAGILFFQDRSIPTTGQPSSFDGTNGSSFTGALYFSTTTVQYKGNPSHQAESVIVAWDLEFKGTANLNDTGLTSLGSPAQSAIIVE